MAVVMLMEVAVDSAVCDGAGGDGGGAGGGDSGTSG